MLLSSYKLVAIKLVTPPKEHLEAHCSWSRPPVQTLELLRSELPRHAAAPRRTNILLTASHRRGPEGEALLPRSALL